MSVVSVPFHIDQKFRPSKTLQKKGMDIPPLREDTLFPQLKISHPFSLVKEWVECQRPTSTLFTSRNVSISKKK